MTEPHRVDGTMTQTVREFQAGRETAFADLVREHQGSVYAILLGYVRSREDAVDLTQEVFLRAWRGAGTLRRPERFGAWLATIARNTALNFLKRRQAERRLLEAWEWTHTGATTASDEDIAGALEVAEGMDEIYRTPLLLKYVDGRSVDEIARMLDVPASTVEGRLYQARLQLRKKLTM